MYLYKKTCKTNHIVMRTVNFARKIVTIAVLFVMVLTLNLVYSTGVTLAKTDKVLLGGDIVGFEINYDGVLITGFNEVETDSGYATIKSELKSGDLIKRIDGIKISSPEQIYYLLNNEIKKEKYVFSVVRNGIERSFGVCPLIEKISGERKLGISVKSAICGIGTLTFICKDGSFGALGHCAGVSCGEIDGSVYDGIVLGVSKSRNGNVGSIKGALNKSNNLGEVSLNNDFGIFGKVNYGNVDEFKEISVGDARVGKAQICSGVSGKIVQYDAEIVKINNKNRNSEKGLIVKITDERLISITGGIVQGMSGSPILQNGKIVGAITHVFVSDTHCGYGICIDNMLNSAKSTNFTTISV